MVDKNFSKGIKAIEISGNIEIKVFYIMEDFVEYHKFKISYKIFGKGKKVMFYFHGFASSPDEIEVLLPCLEKDYKIFAFYLPLHGKSGYTGKRNYRYPLFKHHLAGAIEELIRQKRIKKFSLMGYSLGGRFGLCIIEKFGAFIENCYLLAPDGIKSNFWYRLISNTYNGRAFYKFLISKPGFLNFLLASALILKIVNQFELKFINEQIDSLEKRQLVYKSWIQFRKLKPDLQRVLLNIRKNHIQLHVFVGKYDYIILPENISQWMKRLPKYCQLTIVSGGHNIFNEKALAKISEVIKEDLSIKTSTKVDTNEDQSIQP